MLAPVPPLARLSGSVVDLRCEFTGVHPVEAADFASANHWTDFRSARHPALAAGDAA